MKTYLTIKGLSKAYGNNVLFEDAHITIHENQKIGLIGRNGAGKSTLMRIITGEEEADSGDILFHPGVSIGYLQQQDEFMPDELVLDYIVRISDKEEWQCGKAAYRFELTKDWLYLPISSLSGGYQMRVKLAAMVAKEPNVILLDEPTNYLDLATVILLEHFINEFKGSVIVISHDREFLKRTCDHTMEVEHGNIVMFPRPLEEYLSHKEVSRDVMERYNEKVEKQKEHLQKFVNRFGASAAKAGQAQSKLKQIARLSTIEIKNPLPTVDINIPKIEQTNGVALRVNNLSIGYKDTTIAKGLTVELTKGEHVVILGNNGQGKSTLLKTIASMILPTLGAFRWTPTLTIAYFGQLTTEAMNPADSVLMHLRKSAVGVNHEGIMRMASNFLFRDDELEKKVSVLSGGEKSRLALAAMLLTKNDVILLDEPTNHLDFQTAEALAFALAGSNRTVIFISHDRTFVSIVADRLIEIKDGQIREYMGSYQDYVDELVDSANQLDRTAQKPKPRIVEAEEEAVDAKKELKENLKKLELEIADLQKEKAKLLKQFEQSNGEFNLARTERFKATEDLIKKAEDEWAELQEKIES